jgi:hypothetical protein
MIKRIDYCVDVFRAPKKNILLWRCFSDHQKRMYYCGDVFQSTKKECTTVEMFFKAPLAAFYVYENSW